MLSFFLVTFFGVGGGMGEKDVRIKFYDVIFFLFFFFLSRGRKVYTNLYSCIG